MKFTSLLIFLYQSMVVYKNILIEMKNTTESFESHPSGFVSQEFLGQDVTDTVQDGKKKAVGILEGISILDDHATSTF